MILRSICFAFIFFLSSCLNKDSAQHKVLKLCLSSDIPSLDPSLAYDQVSNQILAQVYEPLYQFHYYKRPYVIEPLIAEELPSYSDNQKTITIKLKKNILYHDHPLLPQGRTVTALDVVNAFKRLAYIPTQSPGFWLIDGIILGINDWRKNVGNDLNKMINTMPEGLKVIDDKTLQIKLISPSSQLPYALTMPFTAPCPTEILHSLYENPPTIPDYGTGAFTISFYRQGSSINLKKFSKYSSSTFPSDGVSETKEGSKLPILEEVQFSIIKESNTRWLKFLSEESDLESVPKDYFPKVFDENLKLKDEFSNRPWSSFLVPTLTLWWIGFNMKDPTVGTDLNLRLAIAHAIDTAKYRKIFTADVALPMNSIIPPMIAGHTTFQNPFKYNLETAKSFLKKSKIAKSKSKLKFSVRSNDSVGRQIAEFFFTELQAIGLDISIDPMPFQAFLEAQKKGQLQFFVDGWAMDYPHPANMVQLLSRKNFSPGPNHSYFSHDKIEDLYEKMLLPATDERTMQSAVDEIQNIITKNAPWIPLMHSRGATIINKKIKNFNPSPVVQNDYKYLDLELILPN